MHIIHFQEQQDQAYQYTSTLSSPVENKSFRRAISLYILLPKLTRLALATSRDAFSRCIMSSLSQGIGACPVGKGTIRFLGYDMEQIHVEQREHGHWAILQTAKKEGEQAVLYTKCCRESFVVCGPMAGHLHIVQIQKEGLMSLGQVFTRIFVTWSMVCELYQLGNYAPAIKGDQCWSWLGRLFDTSAIYLCRVSKCPFATLEPQILA